MSFYEKDPLFKGSDWVAPRLLPRKMLPLTRFSVTRAVMRRVLGPQGVYEWVIARTRYIDEALRVACVEGFSQVVIFGAGFDSRGVRFAAELKGKMLFELDAPTTQRTKIAQFRARGVEIPQNVILVPVNFERESFRQKLEQAGFTSGCRTFVVLEGVLQYLNPQAAEATLAAIHDMTGKGSRVVFDHAYGSVVRGEGSVYGQERMTRGVEGFGESWQFGLDDDDLGPFLRKVGLTVVDRRSPRELERMNFLDAKGRLRGRVNGTQGIVTAERDQVAET